MKKGGASAHGGRNAKSIVLPAVVVRVPTAPDRLGGTHETSTSSISALSSERFRAADLPAHRKAASVSDATGAHCCRSPARWRY